MTVTVYFSVGECERPAIPANGDVKVFGTTHNSIAVYVCNTGYYLVGGSYRVCLEYSAWSGSVPSCNGKPRTLCGCKSQWYLLQP